MGDLMDILHERFEAGVVRITRGWSCMAPLPFLARPPCGRLRIHRSQLPSRLPAWTPPDCTSSPPLTLLPSSNLAFSTSIRPPCAVT